MGLRVAHGGHSDDGRALAGAQEPGSQSDRRIRPTRRGDVGAAIAEDTVGQDHAPNPPEARPAYLRDRGPWRHEHSFGPERRRAAQGEPAQGWPGEASWRVPAEVRVVDSALQLQKRPPSPRDEYFFVRL